MNPNDSFAAEIERVRRDYINDATRALVDDGRPADVVRGAAFLAGLRWDSEHPTLARRAEAA